MTMVLGSPPAWAFLVTLAEWCAAGGLLGYLVALLASRHGKMEG